MAPQTKSKGTNGSGNPPTLANGTDPGSAGGVSAGAHAASSVPAYGGNRGGRPRKDGLPPGSPEAEKADKKNDRIRKREEREEAARLAQPAPLPSADAIEPGPSAPPSDPVDPGAPVTVMPPEIPWEGKDLREYFDEAISGAEEARVETRKLQALSVGFSDASVKQFAADARYPGSSKRMIAAAGSNGLAKLFNKVKLSREYGEGGMALLAVLLLFTHNRRSDARFKRAVAELQKKSTNGHEEKKP